jgi:cathepsin A (carboxypeptidase C)
LRRSRSSRAEHSTWPASRTECVTRNHFIHEHKTDAQGRYLPVFASAVYDGNAKLLAKGKTPINLQSVMIGNGITDNCESAGLQMVFLLLIRSGYGRVVLSLRWCLCITVSRADLQQCTIHGGLNQTVQSIGNCVGMAEAVSAYAKQFRQLLTRRSRSATSCTRSTASSRTTTLPAHWRRTTARRCWRSPSSPPGETREMPHPPSAFTVPIVLIHRYDVSKSCSRKELSESLCYSVT